MDEIQRRKVGVLVPTKGNLPDESSSRCITIFEGLNFIGRNDLPVADKQVSRRHVCLDGFANGTVKLSVEGQNPINIRSGTSKQRLPSKRDAIIQDGDIIELIPGKYSFCYTSAIEKSNELKPDKNDNYDEKYAAEKGKEPVSVINESNSKYPTFQSEYPVEAERLLLKRKRQILEDDSLARKLQETEDSARFGHLVRPISANQIVNTCSKTITGKHDSDYVRKHNISNQNTSLTFHLLRVHGLPEWANPDSVSITDVIKGKVVVAVLSNYMVDIDWLLSVCQDLRVIQRVVMIHGQSGLTVEHLKMKQLSNWLLHKPPLRLSYGTHHSKAMFLVYERGVRIVVHTANLIFVDWNNKTQGLWMQDFPVKDQNASGNASPFENDLVEYLEALEWPGCNAQIPHIGDVKINAAFFRRFDYSSASVRLIASIPGYHTGLKLKKWGHMKLRTMLQEQYFENEFRGSPLVYQFSSLGSLDEKWMSEFSSSMCSGSTIGKQPLGSGSVQIIWPTVEDVRNSLEGYAAGNAIPSPYKNVEKAFLKKYWSRWKADHTGRSRAMPHIKTYARYNSQSLAWFLLTSANLSKAAWGALQKNGSQLMIRSYELGVLFMPSLVLNGTGGFSCTDDSELQQVRRNSSEGKLVKLVTLSWQQQQNDDEQSAEIVKFPVPYQIPPQPYSSEDVPWSWDKQYNKPDVYGELWPR